MRLLAVFHVDSLNAAPVGIEPTTIGFEDRCSAN